MLPTGPQGVATGGSTVEIALMAMMQQQKDFFVQSQVQAAAQAQATQAQAQAAQAQAAATLAGQQQLSELLGSPLPRILVNSAVPSTPVANQVVVHSSSDVCDTPVLLPMAVLDSAMSLQPCSSSNFLSKPPLTTEVPDTNPSIPLGSPKGQYANLGQGIRAQDQGHIHERLSSCLHLTLYFPITTG